MVIFAEVDALDFNFFSYRAWLGFRFDIPVPAIPYVRFSEYGYILKQLKQLLSCKLLALQPFLYGFAQRLFDDRSIAQAPGFTG